MAGVGPESLPADRTRASADGCHIRNSVRSDPGARKSKTNGMTPESTAARTSSWVSRSRSRNVSAVARHRVDGMERPRPSCTLSVCHEGQNPFSVFPFPHGSLPCRQQME